jgi:hypothetical protein
MAPHQDFEGSFIPVSDERFQQLRIRQALGLLQQRGPAKMPNQAA